MKVKRIVPAGTADVYNMEVEGTHDFAVNGGAIVHNCYDMVRYVAMKNPIAPRPRITKAPKPYDPLESEHKAADYDKYDFFRRF